MAKLVAMTVAIGLAAGLAACNRSGEGGNSAAAPQPAADKAAAAGDVRSVETAVLAAWKAKNVDGVVGHYAADATVMIPQQPAVSGTEALKKDVAEFMKDPAFGIDFENRRTEVAASGDLAYSRGTYKVSYTDPRSKRATTEKGNYVSVFRKGADGSWKLVEDISTPDAMPGAA